MDNQRLYAYRLDLDDNDEEANLHRMSRALFLHKIDKNVTEESLLKKFREYGIVEVCQALCLRCFSLLLIPKQTCFVCFFQKTER